MMKKGLFSGCTFLTALAPIVTSPYSYVPFITLLASVDTVKAASIFWSPSVTAGGGASCNNGTFAWDADSGTAGAAHKCWATTSGGTTASAIPGVSDIAFFDAGSGGGIVTVSAPNNASGAAQINLTGLNCGAFTGTLNFATNNNNVTIGPSGMNCSGTGVRTFNLGNGTWTMSGANAPWTMTTTTNLTFAANSSLITWTATQCGVFGTGNILTYNNVTAACATGTTWQISQGGTISGTLTLTAGDDVFISAGNTLAVNALATNVATSAASPVILHTTSPTTSVVFNNIGSAQTLSWFGIGGPIIFTGAPMTFTNSIAAGTVTGASLTITNPSASGGSTGGGFIIGG